MAELNESGRQAQFSLVTRGHDFLLRALSLRLPESRDALAMFVQYIESCGLPPASIDAVLLRCLATLDQHSGGAVPTLVERYLSGGRGLVNCGARFAACVGDLLRCRGIGDPVVTRAIALMEDHYGERDLKRVLATELEVTPAMLSDRFKRITGLTITEYIRIIRLSRAATLLVRTTKRIKEIWAEVGYNDASNFVHEFEARFGLSPREYRARPGPAGPRLPSDAWRMTLDARVSDRRDGRRCVLIVDDDEFLLRETSAYLRMHGSFVAEASSAEEALREVERLSPDVVLLDFRLGDGMDGIECLRRLRKMREPRPPGVALFTADWGVYDRADEIARLETLIVPKLCDLDEVQQVVVYLSAV